MRKIYFIVAALAAIIYIIYSIRKNKLSVANSLIWILYCIVLLFLSIFPYSIDKIVPYLGISYAPVFLLLVALLILFMMVFQQSKKIEELQKKVVDLSQELSIVKEKVNEKDK